MGLGYSCCLPQGSGGGEGISGQVTLLSPSCIPSLLSAGRCTVWLLQGAQGLPRVSCCARCCLGVAKGPAGLGSQGEQAPHLCAGSSALIIFDNY